MRFVKYVTHDNHGDFTSVRELKRNAEGEWLAQDDSNNTLVFHLHSSGTWYYLGYYWYDSQNDLLEFYPHEDLDFEVLNITKEKAAEFYRDLCGTVYGDSEKKCGGIMSEELIADHMGIDKELAHAYLRACAEYGITERQGGAWVV